MQGSSFWKTVAVVGVIGIGTLVILEVGKNLRLQTTETTPPSDDELTSLVSGAQPGDQTVTPRAESDFDRLVAGKEIDFGGAEPSPGPQSPLFGADEPPFTGGEDVDTDVQMANLVDGPNPFAQNDGQSDEVTAVAANYQRSADSGQDGTANARTASNTTIVEPTAFIGSPGFEETEDVSGGRFQPFQPGDESSTAAVEPPEFESFGSFDSDAPPFSEPPESETGRAPDVSTPDANGGNSTNGLLFVNGRGEARAQEAQERPSPFYREDELQPTQEPLSPIPADDPTDRFPSDTPFESFGNDNTPLVEDVPATSEPVEPFLDFRDSPETETFAPQTNPEPSTSGDLLPFEGFEDAEQDIVPPPRGLERIDPLPLTEPEFNDFDSTPLPIPDFDSTDTPPDAGEGNGDLLPFEQDIPNDTPLAPFDNTPAAPGRTTVPDFDVSPTSPAAIPRDTTAPDSPRTFEPLPEFPPRFEENPRIEITPRGGSSREDLTPVPGRESQIEIRPRNFNDRNERPRAIDDSLSIPIDRDPRDAAPEFGGSRSTRPADFGAQDRGGRVRNVSGIMRPNLVLQKSAPENATVGVPLDYKIFIRNEGDATAYDVIVEDEVADGARVEGAMPQSVRDRTTQNLIWNFPEILPNETKEIVVRVTPTGEGTLDGVATVRFKSRVKATTVITAPKLVLEMAGPDESKLGQEVAYRYIVSNQGSGDAQDVMVRTLLPQEGGLKHPAGRDLEYIIGTLPAGQQREIMLKVVAADSGVFTAKAEVTGTGGATANAAWRTNIIGAQLQVVRRGPKRRFVGRTATYENIVSNETNFDALDARVSEYVPEGMEFVSATKGGQYDPATRTVNWRINRLAPDRQEQLQVELRPRRAGTLESVVTIFENAGIESDGHVSTTVVQDLHNVGAEMSRLDGPVAVGESFGFSITVDNRGTADATDVRLVIDVPREIEVVRAGSPDLSASLDPTTNQVQYQIVRRIEPNEQATFELKLTGTAPVQNGLVKARVRYRQMEDPLVVSESVTVYRDDL